MCFWYKLRWYDFYDKHHNKQFFLWNLCFSLLNYDMNFVRMIERRMFSSLISVVIGNWLFLRFAWMSWNKYACGRHIWSRLFCFPSIFGCFDIVQILFRWFLVGWNFLCNNFAKIHIKINHVVLCSPKWIWWWWCEWVECADVVWMWRKRAM